MYKKWLKEFIFEEDRHFKSCHASTLVILSNGTVLSAWFGGTKEGAKDVAIWYTKRVNGIWETPVKLADQEGIAHWNPVLFEGEGGRIYLFYKVGHTIPSWHTMVMVSEDGGDTWTPPKPLVEGDIGGRGPVRNKPIKNSDGVWLAPASVEAKYWDAFVDISYDQGETWFKSQMVPINHRCVAQVNPSVNTLPVPNLSFKGKGIIQPTLWKSKPGSIHMLLRSTEGLVFRSDSENGCKTWSSAYPTQLPNNNSGIDVTRLDNGVLVIVYNPIGENWGLGHP